MKILKLTVYKKAFEPMNSGEKLREYRKPSSWIMSRLVDRQGKPKNYDLIKFYNGGHFKETLPNFTAIYKGFYIAERAHTEKYSNGLIIKVEPGDVVIKFTHFKNKEQSFNLILGLYETINRNN